MCHVEPGVPKKMKEDGLNPFIIYLVRNPFDRIRSHYNYNKKNPSWKGKLDSDHLINTSMYFMQLEEYVKVFGSEKILLVDFDELKHNPEGLCKKVYGFIGASEFDVKIGRNEIKNKTVPLRRSRIKITQKLQFTRKYLPKIVQDRIQDLMKSLLPNKQDLLTEHQRLVIKEKLEDDMNQLKENYDIDISKWGFE
jgi:hypothetical protein